MERLIQEIAEYIRSENRRLVIGISGHGASGKSTFAQKLINNLEQNTINFINTDIYIVDSYVRKHAFIDYEYENSQHREKMTACYPAAHHTFALERDVQMMRDGLDLYSIGSPYARSVLLSSEKKINIVEGMSVAFTNPELYDLRIYLYTDSETEYMRRSVRDITERGMDPSFLKRTHNERRIQYELFMHPKHENFDLVIKNSNEEFSVEKGLKLV
ncbi:uridine kinase [Fictibacillus iocasae]|uniref:Uridine kinase n=1 Tax=Fictibacillus iocasae TaxID=2715437 RepID=A0ABW2NUZ5_9BACL